MGMCFLKTPTTLSPTLPLLGGILVLCVSSLTCHALVRWSGGVGGGEGGGRNLALGWLAWEHALSEGRRWDKT